MHRAVVRISLTVLLAVCLTGPGKPAYALQAGESRVVITSPTSGQLISGQVTITGTVIDPQFAAYLLEYAPDPTPSEAPWQAIQPPVGQQVRAGVLGVWDVSTLPDGRYILRLRVINTAEETIASYEVRVEVRNATPTPLPTARPTATSAAEAGTPTPGPSPTPLIQQPPTRTPRPTITPGGPTATPEPLLLSESPLSPDRLRQAALRGVLIALGVFGALGLYSLIRAAFRGTLQAGWRQFSSEVIHPLVHGLRRSGRRGSRTRHE